mmetsp:Transcript_20808/g.41265  ORF Transcript_20808/g.41265 Transcript_20808/m.41265 type:complete len:215 (+) Transcript_20808:109-753(+)
MTPNQHVLDPTPLLITRRSVFGAHSALLKNCEFDTLALRQAYPRLRLFANHKYIFQASGEGVTTCILDSNNIEGAGVLFDVLDDTSTASVLASLYHAEATCAELEKVDNLACGEIHLDGVIDLNCWVNVANRTAIVSDNERDVLFRNIKLLHAAELESRLLRTDWVENKSALGIVEEAEGVIRSLELDYVHKASRESHVSTHLAINLYELLHAD